MADGLSVLNATRVLKLKIQHRLARPLTAEDKDEIHSWYRERAIDQASWARSIDRALWDEASEVCGAAFAARNKARLAVEPIKYGGGGAHTLLYFLIRLQRPLNVVETGVAAGWSSTAILAALERNGAGHLWSSDAPYRRQPNAAERIGVLVPEALRHRWTLLKDADVANLPRIARMAPGVDFLHYDSDKRYESRQFALDTLSRKLSPGGERHVRRHRGQLALPRHSAGPVGDLRDGQEVRRPVGRAGPGFRLLPLQGEERGGRNSSTTSISPTIAALKASRSSAGIQYSR